MSTDAAVREFSAATKEMGDKIVGLTLKQAKEMLAAGDLAALSAAGHKAKGVLLGIGLEEAAELARQVELNGKAGQAADYNGLLDRLEEGLRPLLVLSGG